MRYLLLAVFPGLFPMIGMGQSKVEASSVSLAEALEGIRAHGDNFHVGLTHGTMRAILYVPKGKDDQTPHEQDEVYVIVSGRGVFDLDGRRIPFQANDVIFVAARQPHHFIEFTEDFKTWVIFYGPKGGER